MSSKEKSIGKIPTLRFQGYVAGWEEKKLSQLGKFFSGGTPKTTNKDYYDGHISFIRSGEINSEKTELRISEEGLRNSSAKMVDKGEILIAIYGANSGDIAISKMSGAINQAILSYDTKANKQFFKNLWQRNVGVILETYLQGGQGNLSAEIIKNLKFYFPNIDEQNKIASSFELIELRINTQKKTIRHYESLLKISREKVLLKIISKKYVQLKDVARIYDGTHQTPHYVKHGIPFFSVENLTANNFVDTKFIDINVFNEENKRVKIERGDILMTRIGDIGTVKFIDWEVNASFYVSLALVKNNEKISSEYLAHFLKSNQFQKELWKRTIHVAFPKKINLGEIGECIILLPNIEEQNKISFLLTSMERKIETEKRILELLEQQKKYFLQNLFV